MKLQHKLKGPWRITFDTNPDLCNLKCIMCDTHSIYNKSQKTSKSHKIMPIQIIENVLKSTHIYLKEIIPSTMGEPLLYPYFEKVIELAKKYKIKINLTTNGTFPKLGVHKWGELLMPILSDIKISINGITKETNESIMMGINFEKQLENIKEIIKLRDKEREKGDNYPTVTFQVTYMDKNLKELPDLFKLAIKMRVDRFKGHHVWITWNELRKESLKESPEKVKQWNKIVDSLYKIKEELKSKIKLDNVYKLLETQDNIPEDYICPFLGREAWINWDGTFNVCCAPDNLRRNFGYFGNVKETDFMKLWNSKKYNLLIENWGNNPICKKCNMRRPIKEINNGKYS